MTSINTVNASEYPEITNDIEIKYRWYKEVITGDYYPLKELTKEDKVDITKIKYGNFSGWNPIYCSLSEALYDIEKKEINEYEKVADIRYVLLENFTYNDNIDIYYENNLIDFKIISNETNKLKLDLKRDYIVETLLIVIDSDTKYKIGFYAKNDFKEEVISKEIVDEKIIVANKNWITDKTQYVLTNTESIYKTSDLTKKRGRFYSCRYREIYTYKYETSKEYYDDNYYSNVEGYIKDTNDYKIFYKGEPITNTIEITKEKIVKEPQIEYIYIANENNKKENDSSQKTESIDIPKDIQENVCTYETKTEVVEKKIFKTPKKIYLLIITLIITIIFLIAKLYKKYVT